VTISEVSKATTVVTTLAPSVVIQGFDPNIMAWDDCKPASPNPSVCSRTINNAPANATGNGTSGAVAAVRYVGYLQASAAIPPC